MARRCCLLLLVLVALPTMAVVLRSGGTVTIESGQVINDDLVVSGGTVRMLGRVTGDLVAAGGTVEVRGPVGGNLVAATGTLIVDGPVGGSAYVAAGTADMRAPVGRNAVASGGTVTVARNATVGRDLAVSGGTTTVEGSVTRNLLATAGTLALANTARVGGNLNAVTSNPQIASGAVIQGERNIRQQGARRGGRRGTGVFGWIAWQLLSGVALLLVGLLFVAIAPRLTEESETMLRTHPWASLLAGFLVLLLVPLAALIVMFTCIGIPLALIALWFYLTAIFISPIFIAILIGRLVWRRPGGSLYLALLIGVALLIVVRLIPVLGFLVTLAAMLFGLGALTLALQARSAHPMYAPAPAQ